MVHNSDVRVFFERCDFSAIILSQSADAQAYGGRMWSNLDFSNEPLPLGDFLRQPELHTLKQCALNSLSVSNFGVDDLRHDFAMMLLFVVAQ